MEEHVEKLCDEMVDAVHGFKEALTLYVEGDSAYKPMIEDVRTHEATMDSVRREMETSLFRFELRNYSQGDKLALVEGLDDVADRAEIAARMMGITRPKIPKKLGAEFIGLVDAAYDTVCCLKDAVLNLYDNFSEATKKAKETEALRRQVRQKEFAILEQVFSRAPDTNSLLLKELASQIGRIADDAEEVADLVAMLSVKYRG